MLWRLLIKRQFEGHLTFKTGPHGTNLKQRCLEVQLLVLLVALEAQVVPLEVLLQEEPVALEAQQADLARRRLVVALVALVEVLEANLLLEQPAVLGVQLVDLVVQRLLLADLGQLADLEVQLLQPVGSGVQHLVDLAVQQVQLVALAPPVQQLADLDLLRLWVVLALRPLRVASVPRLRPAVSEQHLPQVALVPLLLPHPAASEDLDQLLPLRLPASAGLPVGSAP